MKHAKGLFINSSYRRSGLLKTLLGCFRQHRERVEPADEPRAWGDRALTSPGAWESKAEKDNSRVRKAAGL